MTMSFSFGTPTSAPATSGLTSGFSFGAAKPATPGLGSTPSTFGGLFGSPASSAPAFGCTTMPAFGATSTPAYGATTTPAFGATSTPGFGAAAPSFGTTTPAFGATTASSFGTTSTPAFGTTTTQSVGAGLAAGGLNFGANSTAQPGLTFGTPASQGLSATFPQTNTLFGGAGTGRIGTNLGGTQLASSVAPSLGLGGSSTSAGIGVTNTTQSGDGKNEPPKQMKLPNEISTTVATFKEFIKKQKSLSSDVMRVSIKPLNNVSRTVDSLQHCAASLSSSVSRARAHSRRLRSAGADALAAADTAQRQAQGLAYSAMEGAALPRFVKELIAELEQQLITFRRQVDEADKQLRAAPKHRDEQELTLGIRRMHESLIALAGRLQGVHSQVEAQKEQYLNLRRYVLKDPTNIFETQSNITSLEQILRDAESGRKKTGLADSFNSAVLADPRNALGNIQQLAGPTPFSYVGSTVSTYNPANTSGSAWQPQPSLSSSFPAPSCGGLSAFQLQKPPGKRTKQ